VSRSIFSSLASRLLSLMSRSEHEMMAIPNRTMQHTCHGCISLSSECFSQARLYPGFGKYAGALFLLKTAHPDNDVEHRDQHDIDDRVILLPGSRESCVRTVRPKEYL